MLPIRDHNPSERTPYVTYALLLLNIGIFLSHWHVNSDQDFLQEFYWDWAMFPRVISEGERYYTLVTSTFLHAGIMHLAGNMLFLWIFGDNMEEEFGHFGFLLFYLFAGVAANYAQILADPNSYIPTIGASGAIAGVMGGYLLLFPKAKVDILIILIVFFRIIPIPAWIVLGLWFGFQMVSSVTVDQSGGGVAYWAHSGGFIIGFLATLPLWFRRGATAFWTRTEGHPPHPEAHYTRSSIPVVRRK